MMRFILGMGLGLHGLAHSLPGMRTVDRLAGWPKGGPESGSPLLVAAATLLWAAAMVGLVGAGFGAWGVPPLARRWRLAGGVGAGSSLLLLGAFRPEYALFGAVLSALVLVIVWRLADPYPARGTVPDSLRGKWRRRGAAVLATLFLLYLAVAVLARPWHMRWGSADAELALSLPGDDLADEPLRYGIQHAVTIQAPAEDIWPWLVQIGQDRAGFYSYDWLERLFGVRIHNVDRVIPGWQQLAAGDSVFATQPRYLGLIQRRLGWRVAEVDPGRALVLENWGAFVLEPAGPDATRLLVRTRGGGPTGPLDFVFTPAGLLLFEVSHFVMQRRMLLGIRDLAERTAIPLGEMDQEAFLRHLDRQIPKWMERQGVPGVTVLLVHGGVPVWREAYGWADREAGRPLERDTPMMTHSISKSVTAWGVMRLVEEGRIGLDDPVRRHLPLWNPPSDEGRADRVTVRHLLSASSGLPVGELGVHFAPGAAIPPLSETLSDPAIRLGREPGTTFEYSNVGFGLLEWLVESVTGRDFGEFMGEEVLRPLGMDDSSFDWEDRRHGSLPLGYDLRGNPVEPYVYPNRASGGLFSTAEDLGRFVTAGMRPTGDGSGAPVLSGNTLEEMYSPQIRLSGIFTLVSSSYGLGHFLEELPGGRRAVWHGGQGLGWMTHFHAVPATGDGIVILTNSQRSWPLMALILRDWGEWRGFGPIGMGRIAAAGAAMRGVVGLILVLAVWRAWRLGNAARARWRGTSVAPPGRIGRRRVLELGLGLALLGLLLWAVTRDYLFVTSVFPTTSVWLGWSLALLGAVLVAGSMLPSVPREGPPPPDGPPTAAGTMKGQRTR